MSNICPSFGRSSWPKTSRLGRVGLVLTILFLCVGPAAVASAQDAPNSGVKLELPEGLAGGPEKWTSPEGLSSALQVMLLLTVISLAPAVLLMTTCFVRIIVVLGLAAAGTGHAAVAAEPGDHVDRAVPDAAVDDAGLEAGLRRGRLSRTPSRQIRLEEAWTRRRSRSGAS